MLWCVPCVWLEATVRGLSAGPAGAGVVQCHGHVWSQPGGTGVRATLLPPPPAPALGPCLCLPAWLGECSPPHCAPAHHAPDTRTQEGQNSPPGANTACAPCSSQTAISSRDKVLSPCLSCLGSNCFVSAPSSLRCPSLRWRSGYVYTYSTKIKRHKYTQNAADSEQLIRVPGAGKTRMLEGWSGSSGCSALCCLWSLVPEVTLLLCVCCSSLCSPVPGTTHRDARSADCLGADQGESGELSLPSFLAGNSK